MKHLFVILSALVTSAVESRRAFVNSVMTTKVARAAADLLGEVAREFNASDLPDSLRSFADVETIIQTQAARMETEFETAIAPHAAEVAKAKEFFKSLGKKNGKGKQDADAATEAPAN